MGLEEDLEIRKMKMRAEQFEEEYKKKRSMPSKLKPRVFGCFWKRIFSTNSCNGYDTREKIIHDQLMKVLQPYSYVFVSDNNESGIVGDESVLIHTSHSLTLKLGRGSPTSVSERHNKLVSNNVKNSKKWELFEEEELM